MHRWGWPALTLPQYKTTTPRVSDLPKAAASLLLVVSSIDVYHVIDVTYHVREVPGYDKCAFSR